ncbi:hypothetical protein R5R35_004801 [Gryllus longicercus]|uniref:Uncharacterized protein n=1 Tax=Gryllus longicercus TaxID=2509291 RepID=A0AAN9VY14_9ORTH
MDLHAESLIKNNPLYETTSQDTPEYNSHTPTEDSSTSSDSIATTSRDDLLDLAVSDGEQEQPAAKPDVTVITEVVTSKEEIVTEPTNVVSSQESQEHEAQASVSYQLAVEPKEHPVKAPVDDIQNSVAVTAPSVVEIAAGPSGGSSSNINPPPPPPPPVQQVVSVRVSSSVVQGPSPAPHSAKAKAQSSVTKHDGLAQTPAAPASEEDMQRQFEADTNSLSDVAPALPESTAVPVPESELEPPQAPPPALVTEEQPTNIAVQRSEFSVEESSPSSSELSPRRDDPSVLKTVARVVEVTRNSQSAPVSYHTSVSSATSGSRVQFYSEPPSYHREMPSNVAESIRTSVVTSHQHVGGSSRPKYEHVSGGPMGGTSEEAIESRMGRYGTPHREVRISGPHERVSFTSEVRSSHDGGGGGGGARAATPSREQKSFRPAQNPERNYEAAERNFAQPERNYAQTERNYAQTERNYAQPERTYSLPERNYEVDEAVSVMSNGRAHGVQPTTPSPAPPPPQPAPQQPQVPPPTHAGPSVERAPGVLDTSQGRDPNHKFGYVVEGRNYRKYRVEERTPDGFIVGEYGVVSHDDGTLRGVRYTADGTINPQLIYEALVKFLSL